MGAVLNMVGGGGGKATLGVAVTNGTATSVVATKGSDSVSLTYRDGIWSAILPSFGTWTVTITDGTHNNTAAVNASTAGLYTVSIYMPDVPSAYYTQLEYLESTGTQYINTGVTANQNTKMDLIFSGFTAAGSYTIAGSDKGWNNSGFAVGRYPEFGAQSLNGGPLIDGEKHTVALSKYGFTIDGNSSYVPSTAFTGLNIYLFCLNRNGSAIELSSVKIHQCSLESYRNFVPAKRNSDSVLGMYDTTNNVFYTNDGTGSFIAGPAV